MLRTVVVVLCVAQDQPRMYGGLVALRVLARKYEFKADVSPCDGGGGSWLRVSHQRCSTTVAQGHVTDVALGYVFGVQEERLPMEPVVNTTFPVLLPMLQQLLAAPANSGDQVRMACASQQLVAASAACTGCLWAHVLVRL
jgi:hypothetical protein